VLAHTIAAVEAAAVTAITSNRLLGIAARRTNLFFHLKEDEYDDGEQMALTFKSIRALCFKQTIKAFSITQNYNA
jgi:hypothetical protein